MPRARRAWATRRLTGRDASSGTATQIFATYSYQVAFGQLRWGRGVTISLFVVPILVLGIVLISRYLLRDRK